MTDRPELQAVIDRLESANKVLIVSHVNPDADAYGSSIGLRELLLSKNKLAVTVNVQGGSDRFSCIPGVEDLDSKIPDEDWDLVVAVDAAAKERLGDDYFELVLSKSDFVINIDHHISNTLFADLNYVDSKSSSTCEMVAAMALAANWTISKKAALALLSGIYGDTGSFRYGSTSVETFKVAQELIAAGADPQVIGTALYGSKPLPAVRLQAYTLSNLLVSEAGQLAMGVVDDETFIKMSATHEDAEGLVEEIRDIQGVRLAALIYWFGDCWKVSMRSVSEDLNVSDVAKGFGGGGHKQAAAFRWRKDKETLVSSLESALSKILN